MLVNNNKVCTFIFILQWLFLGTAHIVCGAGSMKQYDVHLSVCFVTLLSVSMSVCLSVTAVSPTETSEPIENPFGVWT